MGPGMFDGLEKLFWGFVIVTALVFGSCTCVVGRATAGYKLGVDVKVEKVK